VDAGTPDADLLRRYVGQRDELAFEALVRKHGPMVLGVCRRVLRNRHDADDAFQATFLVLLRKAASIRSPGTLGSWLYGVAYRTALHARQEAGKRRAKEAAMGARTETPEGTWADLLPVLDQELERLPEKYRAVVVLCDLQGKTRSEAALHVGCAKRTVASRLVRGRALLAKRLTQHGLSVTAGALAGVLSQNAASACVPPSLLASTMGAASVFAGGMAAAGLLSAKVAALTDGVMKTMLLTKLRNAVVVLLIVSILGIGGTTIALQTPVAEQPVAHREPVVDQSIAQKEAEPKSVRALKKAEPTLDDLSRALGMNWWQFDLPKNIGTIEIGIIGFKDGQNRFTVIKHWELREFLVPGPLKIAYQEVGLDEYKLVLITKAASTQVAKNKKPSAVSVTWGQGQKRGEFFELLQFAGQEALVIKMIEKDDQ